MTPCFAFGAKIILLRGLMKASLTQSQSTAEVASDSKTTTEWTREVLYACGIKTVMAVSKARHGMGIVKHELELVVCLQRLVNDLIVIPDSRS